MLFRSEARIATGFIAGYPDNANSRDLVQRKYQIETDITDTVGETLLGTTIGCARCHNHKFDPIAMTDYYAVVACFAGVQHGERAVKPGNSAELQAKADALRRELGPIERQLAQFDPPARPGRTLVIHNEDPKHTTQLLPSKGPPAKYPDGLERGQAGDTGNASRLPTLGRGYLYWNNVPGKNVFAWSPQVAGRFRAWLSWGGGYATHAHDARYVLDRDGDAATTTDQTEIARVSHQKFADGSGSVPGQREWSGFFDAGVHELTPATKIFLRGGTNDQYVSGTLTVGKAVVKVIADSKAKTYGDVNPAFTYSLSGFVNGENISTSDVTGQPTLSTTATALSPVDLYDIFVTKGTLSS